MTPFQTLIDQYEKDYIQFYGREQVVTHHRLSKLAGLENGTHPTEVHRFFQAMKDKSPASRNRYRALLKHLLKWGTERGLVEGPIPINELKAEPEHNARTRRLADQEEVQLSAAMGTDLRLLFWAALDTGLRRGTLFKLKGKDHLPGLLLVPAAIQKHKESQRIPLTQRLQAGLSANLAAPSQRLFDVPRFRDEWDRVRTQCGCLDLHWHDLRGEFASRLSERKVPVEIISKLLGHSTLTMTQRYLRPRVSDFEDAIASLGV